MLTPSLLVQSLDELRSLIQKFQQHVRLLKDWSRSGGPINPIWIRDTQRLQTDLHRAQYRAARRIFTSGQEHTSRCLGAFLVHRKQRVWSNTEVGAFEGEYQRRYLDELVACKAVGVFERFGEQDVAFVCDFCDGHMIWEDLESVPTVRSAQDTVTSPISPVSPTSNNPYWQATGKSKSGREEKQTVFAPIVIANHIAPSPGEWQSRLICPFCEDSGEPPRDEDDEEEAGRPDTEFEDVAALQEHLEWQHTSSATNSSMPLQLSSSDSGCVAM